MMENVYVTRATWEHAVKPNAQNIILGSTVLINVNAIRVCVICKESVLVIQDILVKNVISRVLLEHLEKIVKKTVHVSSEAVTGMMENVIVMLVIKE
jgi:hypothetical protein